MTAIRWLLPLFYTNSQLGISEWTHNGIFLAGEVFITISMDIYPGMANDIVSAVNINESISSILGLIRIGRRGHHHPPTKSSLNTISVLFRTWRYSADTW